MKKNFDVAAIVNIIKEDWTKWAKETNANKMIVGISGGKDSSVVAALAVETFGKENVIGILMPQGKQKDIEDALELVKFLQIENHVINIEEPVNNILNELFNTGIEISNVTEINLPPRIRMSVLFAAAQSLNGRVINTSNLSEDMVGYATLFGDNLGTYAPIAGLTVEEVKKIGIYLGLPKKLVNKVPADGLCGRTDEENLGLTYKALDNYIRRNKGSFAFKEKVNTLYKRNKFKLDIVKLPQPQFNLPNYITGENINESET